jgi:alginate O-acetyltransferase complex protein AlgI
MVFSSPVFLFLFLPIVVSLYWILGHRARNLFLVLVSLVFYTWGEGKYVALLLVSIAANYLFGILVDRYRRPITARLILLAALVVNLGILFYFKYAAFFLQVLEDFSPISFTSPTPSDSAHLPIGLSFFTFQAIAYVIDVNRGVHEPQRNPVKFALFMAMFPKITAGPIMRYGEIESDLARRVISAELFVSGVERFIIGLGKKILLANVLAKTAEPIFHLPGGDLTGGLAWLGIICYTFQIYFDFSGYSDMAIGLGRMFGFHIQENFNYPYISQSVTEFWRRWHISLSSWFKDYLFIPLNYTVMTEKVRSRIAQGAYTVPLRTYGCVIVVFTLCGLWHGASWNFIVWGMLHGLALALEGALFGKLLKRCPRPVRHLYTFTAIMLAWVFFRTATLSGAGDYLRALAGFGPGTGTTSYASFYLDNELILTLMIALLASTPLVPWLKKWQSKHFDLHVSGGIQPLLITSGKVGALGTILALSLVALAAGTYNPFLYYQF